MLNQLRRTDLNAILTRLEATRDKHDRKKWHTPVGKISVSGHKFFNWKSCIGGGGAINLVMHLLDCDFKTAFLWLTDRFSYGRTDQIVKKETSAAPALKLPTRDDSKLARVIQYLVGMRSIQPQLIQSLIDSGTLYPDARANAVFLLLGKEKRVVGAELRGTTPIPWRGMAPGSRKDLGYFSVGCNSPAKVVLCESAIDAISCFALYSNCLAISTSGASPNPAWLQSLLHQGFEIFCGFDSDQTGDKLAQKMIQFHPTIKRLQPHKHDWNDVLKSRNLTRLLNPKPNVCAKPCKTDEGI